MGRRGSVFGARYPYETLPYGYEATRAGSLIGKVMLLLTFSFLVACVGTFVGASIFTANPGAGVATYFGALIGGLVVLLILNFTVQVRGLNLLLLYVFTFLEGVALAPILLYYVGTGQGNILGEAFLITAVMSLSLSVYAWTTKRDFSRLGDYLFFGLILLLITGIVGIFFRGLFTTGILGSVISLIGIAIFSGYVLFYVQRARYLADTLPNAIMLTVGIFITVMNLFLYILQLLSILSGNRRS